MMKDMPSKISLSSCSFGIDIKNKPIELSNYYDSSKKALNEIGPLSKINLFVGANNTGKSRFLRSLAQIWPLRFQTSEFFHDELASGLTTIFKMIDDNKQARQEDYISFNDRNTSGVNSYRAEGGGKHLFALKERFNTIDFAYFNAQREEKDSDFSYIVEWLKKYSAMDYSTRDPYNTAPNALFQIINNIFATHTNTMPLLDKFIDTENALNKHFKRCYIPILRTLNRFDDSLNKHEAEAFYEKRIRKLYFQGENAKDLEIFTGQSFYFSVQSMLLGDRTQRDKIRAFEQFLSKQFFDESEVTLVPNINDDVVHVKIGDEDDMPIYHLGDAIQNLIMLTFPIFENKDNQTLFFIEEPEIHLHPSMQRKFMEAIQGTDYPHQFFITTHSNHLLDLTLGHKDISVFSFKKQMKDIFKPVFYITNTQTGDESILSLLGVQSSSVFLSNATIWVEGITDRQYIRVYLKKYLDWLAEHHKSIFLNIEEDLDYAFIEYSGGNIAHWTFLDSSEVDGALDTEAQMRAKRITKNIFLIADQDGADKKLERKTDLESVLGDRFYLLRCKEIENLLPPEIIKSIVEHHESRKCPDFSLSVDFAQDDYKDIGLGEFIEDTLFKEASFQRKGGYKAQSGTLKASVKDDFCKKAIPKITWDNMSQESKLLARKIYQFILSVKYPGKNFDEFPLDISPTEPIGEL